MEISSALNYILARAYYPTLIAGALTGLITAATMSWRSGLLGVSVSSAVSELVSFIVPATALGLLLAVVPVWLITKRIISRVQGAPFATGDSVTILKGEHRGKTTKVAEVRGKEGVRLELGEHAKAALTDVYLTTEICNVR